MATPAKRALRSALLIAFALVSLSMLAVFPGTASAQRPSADISAGNVALDEGGEARMAVSLLFSDSQARISSNVIINLTSNNSDVTFSPATVTFTEANKHRAQAVTVSAAQDDDKHDETATITLTPTNDSGAVVSAITVTATVTDDDLPSADLSAGNITLDEGGEARMAVSLLFNDSQARISSNVVINLTSNNSDVTISPASVTFTEENKHRAQAVTVSAARDTDADDDTATITLTPTSTSGAAVSAITVTATVTDDGALEFKLTKNSLTLTEGGGSGTFAMHPAHRPSANMTVSLTSSNSRFTVEPSTLEFARWGQTNAWNRYKEVTVSAAPHDNDINDESFSITIRGLGGGYESTTASVSVTVDDDDTVTSPRVTINVPSTLEVAEGGSKSLSVSLSAAPNATATVSLSESHSDITISENTLTFTASNYSTAQTVTVSGGEDDDAVDDTGDITLSPSTGISGSDAKTMVTVKDNDEPSFNITKTSLTIDEGGEGTFAMHPAFRPSGDITVNLTASSSLITIEPSTLEFARRGQTNAWNRHKEVTVRSLQDEDTDDESITVTITGSGANYAGVTGSVSVSVNDDDTATNPPPINPPPPPINPPPPPINPPPPPTSSYTGGIIVDKESIEITEGGRTSFTLSLDTAPQENVTIAFSSSNPDLSFSRNSLVFSPGGWRTPLEIELFAARDSDSADETGSISFSHGNREIHSMEVAITDSNEGAREPVKSQALALPPPDVQDSFTLRIQCRQSSPCSVFLGCTAQSDGSIFEGHIPEAIPAHGAASLTGEDIRTYTGGESWSGKGRLGCSLHSDDEIASQVWTRSGEGVLVNNSAMIRSVLEGNYHRADIESIPSPDSNDESNIRIRCNSQTGDCETSFVCYSDEGTMYDWNLGRIDRLTTRHLQSEELATGIGYRWEGLGLTCELRSKARFTAQVLTRTGGGGALVNNSATGELR